MKNNVKALLFLLLCYQFATGQNKAKQIDSLMTSLYTSGKFNGTVLIAEKGKIIYKNCFGFAREETSTILNDNSVFELASVSKQFTAMAIVILKEKGKLKLDDKIGQYIPGLSCYDHISIRNLLQHTGGLPDYENLIDSLVDKNTVATNDDVASLFAKYKPAALFEPNTKYQYSNTGYALLATIIENVSSMTYQEFMRENIFAPLKMNSTFACDKHFNPSEIINYAFGYKYDSLNKNSVRIDNTDKYFGIVGQAHLKSTITDLFTWDRALNTTALVSRESLNEIFTNGVLNSGEEINYGLGWWLTSSKDLHEFGKMASHTGGLPGYGSKISRFTISDRTIILLTNHDEVDVQSIHNAIKKIVFNKL